MRETEVTMDTVVSLAKRRGFIYPGSEIYGGLANTWDYGPLGAQLKQNIKQLWWRTFVQERLDIVGIDGALLMNPKVWEASGHLETFHDPLVECKNCHARLRADHVDESEPCPECGAEGSFTEPASFNLMFKTFVGPKEDAAHVVYLRPETAQTMFVDFPAVVQTSRQRIPFGIAQVGKAFRNEITPGNFIFRTREFEQMEIEYFVHPDEWEAHFEEFRKRMHEWMKQVGIDETRVHELEVPKEERAHYSSRTLDIEFDFPFGRDELYGLAYRGDFDLRRHGEVSGVDMSYADPASGERYIPHVVEPTFGVDRTLLAVMLSVYREEEVAGESRVVLGFPGALAPFEVAVLPLSKKDELLEVSLDLAQRLARDFRVDYDTTQSIGKRYRRQDEVGTPFCVTIDFDTLKDKQVTIRDRDSMGQERVSLEEVGEILKEKL